MSKIFENKPGFLMVDASLALASVALGLMILGYNHANYVATKQQLSQKEQSALALYHQSRTLHFNNQKSPQKQLKADKMMVVIENVE